MKKTNKYHSIGFRLAIIFVGAVLLQCLVMGVLLLSGGVITETETNAYGYFSSQVESRKDNFESQMKLIWTDFGIIPEEIAKEVAVYRESVLVEKQTDDDLLRVVAPHMIELLKRTKTTGVFLILPNQEEGTEHSALYMRNMNPNQKGEDSYNLTLKSGPMDIARSYNFATSDKWGYKLELDESNEAFYKNAYQNRTLDVDEKLLNYWSAPFSLKGDKESVVAYSIPIKDANGQELGVLGIELNINYLYKFLPKSDLAGDNSLGFILAMRKEKEGEIYPVVAKEKLHGKVINLEESLNLLARNRGLDIYDITNSKAESSIVSCIKEMDMYQENTPFSNEQWYLIGLMNKSELLKFSDRISTIMLWSLFVTVLFGIIAAILTTRVFSKPIVRLADEVRQLSDTQRQEEQSLSKTGLYEIDQLSEAILVAQGKMSDLNEKLKYERDRDAMTGIRNRHAFKTMLEEHNRKKKEYQNICMGLFDLNGLKQVNDNYGHASGDRYICDSVQLIGEVFHESPLFRIGGDEFAIILTNVAPHILIEKQQRLMDLVNNYNKKSKFLVGIAFGYAFYLEKEEDLLEQTIKRADANMYIAKKKMKEEN